MVGRGRSVETRAPLSRDRVLRAAVKLADEGGIASVTMRRLAEELDAEAMSLYHHVANKDQVLDGVVDAVAAEINEAVSRLTLPAEGPAWKEAARRRILTARQVLLGHPWAPAVFSTRTTTSPEVLLYFDGLLGIMRAGGFSNDLAHHAMHALGSRAIGFSQELFSPTGGPTTGEPDPAMAAMAAQLPNLVGMLAEVAHDDPDSTLGWCDDQAEFEFGLDLLLDGLDRRR
ncbi:TetR/AcrR family transcriptional regulator [Catellatospora bangladeshensis]|uniref:TetR family transcriptional regulator n=1 Tax=Catellatospora bangladeshensis TaxID=310355 RepID=A0A8J3JHA2_9ACTN|nr:TetR/AcrR family transcriptional regulator C-terminal domain-containing protein [Catellatospora bangladeshensis]GIF80482.1 TetR family transcriptional regulator [Catellatospora bangladeshensis]